jgi:hypothetical protein
VKESVNAIASNYPSNDVLKTILNEIMRKPSILREIFFNSEQEINNFGIYKLVLNDYGYPREVFIDDLVPVY